MNLLEIIQKRKPPGILLFNRQGEVVFFNEQALKILSDLTKLPATIKKLYQHVRNYPESKEKVALLNMDRKTTFSLRSLTLKCEHSCDNYIMILIEKIAEKPIDFKKIRKYYSLTQREIQVLRLICEGLSNKEIANKLFISEYTVKDHLKKIMKKLNVASRNEIIALLIKNN